MVWKKDLEKLKKSLAAEDPAPSKAPPPKPKPTEFKPMEEEDAVFLSAMGKRPKAATPSILPGTAIAPPAAPAPPPPPALDFASAMGELKGMVALTPAGLPVKPAAPPAAKPPEPPAPAPAPVKAAAVPAPEAPEPPADPQLLLPVQINLAAGMAIDVDGALDLKGHGRNDAEERLKERILDGYALGWRSLHVLLGPAEDLRSMLLDLVGRSQRIARYAQAPIPMGGSQAWILYFRNPGPPAETN